MSLPIERRIASQSAFVTMLDAAERIVLNVANEAALLDDAWEASADNAVAAIRATKTLIRDVGPKENDASRSSTDASR